MKGDAEANTVQNDRRLAAQISEGSSGAFTQFVDTFGPRLHRLARRYAVSEPDAEDLTQEIFVSLYRSMGSYRGESSLATWTYRVALNHCLKHAGRNALITVPYNEACREAASEEDGPAQQSARRELSDQLQTALDGLSPDHRDAVILHELQDLTYRECADILQVPVGTVKSRLSYAFRHLREHLGGYVLEATV